MNRIISLIMFIFAACTSVYLIYMTRYIIGFRKSNLLEVTGYLAKTELLKNVFRGHPFSGKWYKHWTNYEYTYRINGQQYSICGGRPGQKKALPQSITIAVQKDAPKNAVIPQFDKFPSKWILCYLLLGLLLFCATGVCLWSR